MKFMLTLGDEISCNDSIHNTIYVNANHEPSDTVESNISDVGFLDMTRTSKQIRKACRNSGKAYITSSGKMMPEKKVTPLTECRAKCNSRFTFEMQQAIFKEYWSLGSYDKRAEYVSSMIAVADKKSFRPRNYHANKEKFRMKTYAYSLEYLGKKHPTCKGCFLKTLDESEGMVKTVALKKRSSPTGIIISDMRGKHSPSQRDVLIIPAKSTLPHFC